jgi:hypothetical protein
MTEDESTLLKAIIDMITRRMVASEYKELMATHDADAHAYGSEAWVLQQVLRDIQDIIHNSIADEYQKRMEKDIASMEQGIGGE